MADFKSSTHPLELKFQMRFSGPIFLMVFAIFANGIGEPVLAGAPARLQHRTSDDKDSKKGVEDKDREARELYKQAAKNFNEQNYWQAAVDLILILDFYPSYSRLEDAVYLLGTCLYEMEMYSGADRMYRYLLKSVKRTRLVAEAILGLQKVAYKRGEYQQSLKFYKALEAHYSQHETIYESRYYAEQTYYTLEKYSLVHNIVPHIKKKSEFYSYALYTSGLAHLKKKMSGRPLLILSI